MENIQKNNYKKIVYDDFIRDKPTLKTAIINHDNIISQLIKKYKIFVNKIDTKDFRKKIKKLHKEFNKKNPQLKFNQEINSLSKNIIANIIMNTKVNNYYLTDPYKTFWKLNREYFLNIRNKKQFKNYLEKLENFSNQLIEKNKFIIQHLEIILNNYTKEYGLSLGKELVNFYE